MVPPKNKAFRHTEGFQRVEKPFSARWQAVKKVPEAEQLAPVGVQRYGRARVATEVKTLAEQAEFFAKSFLICHSEECSDEESFSTEVRRSFAFAQDDIDRNLDSVSDTLSCHSDFDGYGLFDSLKAFRHSEGFHCPTRSRWVTTISSFFSSSGEKN